MTKLVTITGERQQVREPAHSPSIIATPFRWVAPEAIPVREWLYGRHTIRKFLSATVAAGGTGKTALAVAEMLAFITGNDLLNDHLRTSGRAWYIGLEDPLEEYQRRIGATALHFGIAPAAIEGGLFLDSGRDQDFVIAREQRGGVVIAKPIVQSLVQNIIANDIALVVVDPFIACHSVRENDNAAIDAVVREWAHIADETGCAIELVHHVRKGTVGVEVTADDARGAKALVDKARSVRLLVPMTKEEAERAEVKERRRFFQVVNGKANLALPPEGGVWRQLVSTSLGNGHGGPDDIIGVVARWTFPSTFDGMTVTDLAAVQRCIAGSEWRADVQAERWAGIAVAETLGLDAKGDRESIKRMLKTWIANGALKLVDRQDEKRMARKFVEVGERVR